MATSGSNSMKEADQQIIGLLRQKGLDKRKGEESLFNEYAYFIQDGMRKHRLSEEEAFDAYSDSVLVAIETISNETFKGDSSIKSYLYKIFHNKCVDLFRRNATNEYIFRGMNKDEALQQAKLYYISQDKRGSPLPCYWAAMILIGNTEPVQFSPAPKTGWLIEVGILLALLIVFALLKKSLYI